MPACPIHDDDPMGAWGDGRADLFKMLLHGFGIGIWCHQRRALVSDRTDRAKDTGALIALIGNLTWPGSFWSPLINLSVLLANACFILEPQFNRLIRGDALQGVRQDFGEVFLNAAIVAGSCLRCCGRALTWEKPSDRRSLPIEFS